MSSSVFRVIGFAGALEIKSIHNDKIWRNMKGKPSSVLVHLKPFVPWTDINRDQSSWKASFGIDSIKKLCCCWKISKEEKTWFPCLAQGQHHPSIVRKICYFLAFSTRHALKYTPHTYTREEVQKVPTLINCVRIPGSSFPPGWFHRMRLIRENATLVFLTTGLGFPIKWVRANLWLQNKKYTALLGSAPLQFSEEKIVLIISKLSKKHFSTCKPILVSPVLL